MKNGMISTFIIAAAVMLSGAAVCFAQLGPPSGTAKESTDFNNDPDRGSALSEDKRQEIMKKIEAIRIWKLTEALRLDAPTSAKLASYLDSLDHQRKDIIRDQIMSMRELRRTLKASKPDEAKLKISLDKIEKNHHAMHELREREIHGLREILTTEQQARYLIFQQEFQREMRNIIANARGGSNRGSMGKGAIKREP